MCLLMILCAKIRFKSEKNTRTMGFLGSKGKKSADFFGGKDILTYLCAYKCNFF